MGTGQSLRRRIAALALGAALAASLIAAPGAGAVSQTGPLTQACVGLNPDLLGPCHGVEQVATAATALCRYLGVVPEADCATPLTPTVVRDEIDAYQHSWAHRALRLQYELGNDVGLRNAQWIGTHNSFNSAAEMGPTLSDTDSNQQLKLTDQLRLDMRSLEIDVHWFPSLASGGANAAVVCHALDNHAGCSIEKGLGTVLDEIGGWMRRHSHQVLLLYVEDHLDTADGYDTAAGIVNDKLGDLLYRPPSGAGCTKLPLDLTRKKILAAGAQVLIVSGCGQGSAWPGVIWDWSAHKETRPKGFTDFPDCGSDWDRATFNSTLIRYFEDSTGLTAGTGDADDGITPQTAAEMERCGVDLLGMDQLLPGDLRLESLVWSWAPGQPKAGRKCAVERVSSGFPFGRFFSARCSVIRRSACRKKDGTWKVPRVWTHKARAARVCRNHNAKLSVPRTGYEAQLLRLAMKRRHARRVWLAYRRHGTDWAPTDSRP